MKQEERTEDTIGQCAVEAMQSRLYGTRMGIDWNLIPEFSYCVHRQKWWTDNFFSSTVKTTATTATGMQMRHTRRTKTTVPTLSSEDDCAGYQQVSFVVVFTRLILSVLLHI